jgi:dienelactone hydrolase
METITGTAADVPFTALPPAGATDNTAPLIVTWHMLDAPRTDAAFAAALPMTGVPAWRVHLGMPMCGARMVDGRVDAILELARKDALMAFLAPFVHQAADEFPDALVALRDQLQVDDEPIGVLGGSLGGAVALEVLTRHRAQIKAVALVNPAVRIRSVIGLVQRDMAGSGQEYPWTAESRETADELDFVARATDIAAQPPLLLVSGELDHPALRADALDLVTAMGDRAELLSIPGLAHPLADEPGIEAAPQLPPARQVDAGLVTWFRRHLPPA